MAPAYQPEELLKVRENVKDASDVVRKINSEAGIRSKSDADPYQATGFRERASTNSISSFPPFSLLVFFVCFLYTCRPLLDSSPIIFCWPLVTRLFACLICKSCWIYQVKEWKDLETGCFPSHSLRQHLSRALLIIIRC